MNGYSKKDQAVQQSRSIISPYSRFHSMNGGIAGRLQLWGYSGERGEGGREKESGRTDHD